MIDTSILHSKIVATRSEFLHELFGAEVRKAGPDQWRVGRRGSLAIALRNETLVFYSHEEGQGGDAIALWQRQRGGSTGEALRAVAAWAGVEDDGGGNGKDARKPSTARPVKKKRERSQRYDPQLEAEPEAVVETSTGERPRMTDSEFAEAFDMMSRLGKDRELCRRIAQKRGWKEETIYHLVLDGVLGWSDGWENMHEGAIAFLYEAGIKHRWQRHGERVIRWYRGGPRVLWRERCLHDPREIWIMEGESDAISMINTGIEDSGETLITAVPNAGVVPWGLAEFVRGRKVVLALDNDPAGRAARDKIAAIVQPVAAQLEVWKA